MLKKVFTPYKIGTMEIPNRLVVSAMVTNFAEDDGKVSERFIRYHEEKAKGGWGLIIPENFAVVKRGKSFPNIPGIWEDEQIESHKKFTDTIHKYQSKVVAQIFHAGRQTLPIFIEGQNPVAPSAVACPARNMPLEALSTQEVYELIEAFGDAAVRAKAAGYDGVEVHGAHGYLIGEFLSPYTNKRSDEFGGPLHNRVRFAVEIIKNIKKKAGNKYPMLFRISADELVDGGITVEDAVTIATIVEDCGIDAIHVSAGVSQTGYGITPPAFVKHGWITDHAEKIKKAVSIPVITVGRINDIFMAEAMLKSNKADFVSMARASLADPYMPNKAAAGDHDDILRCIGCVQGCPYTGNPMRCLVNPLLGREYEFDIKKTQTPKKVYIAGGGIAGCEAAIFAAKQGHDVTIFEKTNELGGQFLLAAVPPDKGEITTFTYWQRYQIKKLNVKVIYNTELTKDIVLKDKPDTVIIATGSKPFTPPIPGLDNANAISSHDYLAGKALATGTNVLVIGGGLVGVETAEMLCNYNKKVTIAEMLVDVATTMPGNVKKHVLSNLAKYGVKILINTKVNEITKNGVIISCDDSEQNIGTFDTIIIAAGVKAYNPLESEIKGLTNVLVAGDAVCARTALEAVTEGFEAALKI